MGFLGGLSGKGTLHDACSTVESHVDVRADMVFAEQLTETVVLQHAVDIGCNARKHDVRTLAMTHFAEVLQVVDTRGVDERYATHTDDANLRMVVHGSHQFLDRKSVV